MLELKKIIILNLDLSEATTTIYLFTVFCCNLNCSMSQHLSKLQMMSYPTLTVSQLMLKVVILK